MAQGETYEEFVEKFKPKLTTDDCYTPPEVYEFVKNWACKRYGIEPESIVRPFWPGGDYEHFEYPDGCCVLDNPPFSIQKDILEFYNEKGIPYFLFGNGRTAIVHIQRSNIVIGGTITYQNGARVATCFYTNLGDAAIECDPELTEGLKDLQPKGKEFPIYGYPPEIVSIGFLQSLCNHPVPYVVQRKDIVRKVSNLRNGNGECVRIYGGSVLLTEEAAVQKQIAQKQIAQKQIAQKQIAQKQIAQKQIAQKQIERKRIPLFVPAGQP